MLIGSSKGFQMKLILDVSVEKWSKAMNAAGRVMRNNPQQKTGTSYGVKDGTEFLVIRNQGSYTVKEQ